MQNEMMMRQLETTQDERDRLKKHVEDTKSTFQSSIRSLEQQREMELKDLEKARDALKEQQTAEKAILEENQSLKAELIQCRKRLLPLSSDDASSPQDQQQLLDELIQLRKEHTKLTFETKSLQGDNQRWVEAYDKISQDYNDVSSNNERLRGELSALREQIRQTGESDAHLAQEVITTCCVWQQRIHILSNRLNGSNHNSMKWHNKKKRSTYHFATPPISSSTYCAMHKVVINTFLLDSMTAAASPIIHRPHPAFPTSAQYSMTLMNYSKRTRSCFWMSLAFERNSSVFQQNRIASKMSINSLPSTINMTLNKRAARSQNWKDMLIIYNPGKLLYTYHISTRRLTCLRYD